MALGAAIDDAGPWSAAMALALVLHALFRLLSPREQPLPTPAPLDGPLPPRRKGQRQQQQQQQQRMRVVVTGGAGFLGSAIVRQLADRCEVTVLDRVLPSSERRVARVSYVAVELATADLQPHLQGVDVVVHTAGVVCLLDDPGLLHNAHVVATANVVRAARLSTSVRALCFTSSSGAVTSPWLRTPQLRVPCDFTPPADFPFASHYSRTKYLAERLALEAKARAEKGPAEGEEEAEPEPGDWHRGPAGARWCDRLCFPAVFARQEQAQAPAD